MLSADNPMRDKAVHQAAMAKILLRQKSKNEVHFEEWCAERAVPIHYTGDGSLWIGRRNPDFRVDGQKKLIEVTQKECFIGRRKQRSPMEYGMQTVRHYRSKGWDCLVVFKRDHRCTIPAQLLGVIQDFVSKESSWSGVWNFAELIPFDGASAAS